MGFADMRDAAAAECAAIDTPAARALGRVLGNVAVVDVLRQFYKENRLLKPFWQRRIGCIVALTRAPDAGVPPDAESAELVRLLQHVVGQVAGLEHAADLQVRGWARASAALHGDDEALSVCAATFCRAIDERAARDAVRLALSGTLAECSRLGYFVVPFE